MHTMYSSTSTRYVQGCTHKFDAFVEMAFWSYNGHCAMNGTVSGMTNPENRTDFSLFVAFLHRLRDKDFFDAFRILTMDVTEVSPHINAGQHL